MSATFVSQFTLAGAAKIFISRRNQYGIMTGFAGLDGTVYGASAGMKRCYGLESMPSPVVPPVRVRRTYDDGPGRIYQFPGVAIPQGDLMMGITDQDLEAAVQGSTVWIRGQWKKSIRGLTAPSFVDMFLLMHTHADSEDAGTPGAPGFMNTLFLDCQLLPLGTAEYKAQTPSDARYSVIFNQSTLYADGRPIDSTNFTTLNGTEVHWWSTYPTVFDTFIGDGVTAALPLSYTPQDAASTKVSQAVITGGVVTVTEKTVSSVSTSGKTATVSSAPPVGSFCVIEYEAPLLA